MRTVIFTNLLNQDPSIVQESGGADALNVPPACSAAQAHLEVDLTSGTAIQLSAARCTASGGLPPDIVLGRVLRFRLNPSVCPEALATLAYSQALSAQLNKLAQSWIGVDARTGQASLRMTAKEPMLKIQHLLDGLAVATA